MAVDLNGSNQFLRNFGFAPSTTGRFTLGAFVWKDSGTNWNTIAKNWASTFPGQFHFGLESGDGDLSLYVTQSDGTVKGPTREGSGSPLATGQWHCVIALADGSNIKLYRGNSQVGSSVAYDGTLKSSHPGIGVGAKLNDTPDGPDGSTPGYWDGRLAELFFADEAWAATERTAFYQRVSPLAIGRGLTHYWPMGRPGAQAIDLIGGYSLRAEGAPAIIAHPRIVYPRHRPIVTPPAAEAAAGFPHSWGFVFG